MADHRVLGLSPVDEAAIDAIAAGNRATNQALAELARALAARHGVVLPEPLPDKAQPKNRSYRFSTMSRDGNGGLAGDVEYADGRVRRFHVSRDETGDLAGDVEDLDPVADAAADAGPATEISRRRFLRRVRQPSGRSFTSSRSAGIGEVLPGARAG